jgi:hypothetical protein
VPGELREYASLDPIVRIGAAIEVLHEQFLVACVRDEIFIESLEIGLADLAVALPPDRALGQLVSDRMLVLR